MKIVIKTLFLVALGSSVFVLNAQDMDLFMPPLNAKVINYVNMNIGKQVDRGECWDLAAKALETAGASHPDTYVFGKEIEHNKEMVYPGDIIQFEKAQVRIENDMDGSVMVINLQHHTAIVYEVKSKLNYRMADQNNGITGKKVGITNMDLNKLVKGTIKVFRPIK